MKVYIDTAAALRDPRIVKIIEGMNIRAYCDSCFKRCDEADARANKPCKHCGNTHFFILDEEHILNNGGYGFASTREQTLDAYYDALMEMESIRVTNITADDYSRFLSLGERCIDVFDIAMDESIERDRRAGLAYRGIPPVIPFVTRLPDMYMRRGHWDKALSAYLRCSQSRYLDEFDFPRLIQEVGENRRCVEAIIQIVEAGEHSQKKIKKQLQEHSPRAINWSLRYYHGLHREKEGNDYIVTTEQF